MTVSKQSLWLRCLVNMPISDYVTHLVADIEQQAANSPVKPVPNLQRETNTVVVNAGSMAELVGIAKEVFPPAEQLEEADIERLVKAINGLWLAYNLYAFFPNEVPVVMRYNIMLSFWDKTVPYSADTISRLPTCNGSGRNCPFKEHCVCSESYDDTIKRYGLN